MCVCSVDFRGFLDWRSTANSLRSVLLDKLCWVGRKKGEITIASTAQEHHQDILHGLEAQVSCPYSLYRPLPHVHLYHEWKGHGGSEAERFDEAMVS